MLSVLSRRAWGGLSVALCSAALGSAANGPTSAPAAAPPWVLENDQLRVTLDAAGTISSLRHKPVNREYVGPIQPAQSSAPGTAPGAGGGLAVLAATDDWPNPAAGPYELAARNDVVDQANGRAAGGRVVLRRAAGGWVFEKTFTLPATGTGLRVMLAVTNTTAGPREIVPVIRDGWREARYEQTDFDTDDRAIDLRRQTGRSVLVGGGVEALCTADPNGPVARLPFERGFWYIPARGWFGIDAGSHGQTCWVSARPEDLNALLPQPPEPVTLGPGVRSVAWSCVPLRLGPGQTWRTDYTYAVAHGLASLVAASADYALHVDTQRLPPDAAIVRGLLAATTDGAVRISGIVRQQINEVGKFEATVLARAGAAVPVELPLPAGATGPLIISLEISGPTEGVQRLDFPICRGQPEGWLFMPEQAGVRTSGVLAIGARLQPEVQYIVRRRMPNDLSTVGAVLRRDGLTGWYEDALTSAHPADKPNVALPPPEAPELLALRGGTASAQIVFRGRAQTVRLAPAALRTYMTDELAASCVRLYRVEYTTCEHVSDLVRGAVGPWPDKLSTLENGLTLPEGQSIAVWLDVTVPRDTRPGLYAGVVSVLGTAGAIGEVPVRVRVAAAEQLPGSTVPGELSGQLVTGPRPGGDALDCGLVEFRAAGWRTQLTHLWMREPNAPQTARARAYRDGIQDADLLSLVTFRAYPLDDWPAREPDSNVTEARRLLDVSDLVGPHGECARDTNAYLERRRQLIDLLERTR